MERTNQYVISIIDNKNRSLPYRLIALKTGFGWFMVFNSTFNNISELLWRSVSGGNLRTEKTGGNGGICNLCLSSPRPLRLLKTPSVYTVFIR